MVTATIFTLFKANTKETTKEVARPKAATSFVVAAKGRHLCILALNNVNVVAVTTILVLHVGVIRHHVPGHYDFKPPVISDLLWKSVKNKNRKSISDLLCPLSPKVDRASPIYFRGRCGNKIQPNETRSELKQKTGLAWPRWKAKLGRTRSCKQRILG